MKPVCIVTDYTAQFPKINFPGSKNVVIIPFTVKMNGKIISYDQSIKTNQLPKTATSDIKPELVPPTVDEFFQKFSDISKNYESIIGIFISQKLTSSFQNALKAAEQLNGQINIQIIDSQSTAIGLGYLVQKAAGMAAEGTSFDQLINKIRRFIPHIYSIFCTPSLSYLYFNGFIENTQAIIGEMLNIYPIYTIEEGLFSPLEKVRSKRHAINYFLEFIEEFDDAQHIGLMQSTSPNYKAAKMLHTKADELFPGIPFTKNIINLPLATLLGPKSFGLVIVENPLK